MAAFGYELGIFNSSLSAVCIKGFFGSPEYEEKVDTDDDKNNVVCILFSILQSFCVEHRQTVS